MTIRMNEPSSWIKKIIYSIEPGGKLIDIACGQGRHSIEFANRYKVFAVDKNNKFLKKLENIKNVVTINEDLENSLKWSFSKSKFKIVLISNYLFRERIGDLFNLVDIGGYLIYETFVTKFTFGREIAYNEDIPEIGRQREAYISLEYKIGENLNIQPSINYAKLERLDKSNNFFSGYISRFAVRYQFNNDLSFRIISEYNDFNETFFIQPLLKWNPNPSTIFYIGSNQNSIHDFNVDPEDFDPMRVNQSQFFVKFQYLIGL